MLALLLYVLFVWAGLQAVPTSSVQINNALSQLANVGNAQKKQTQQSVSNSQSKQTQQSNNTKVSGRTFRFKNASFQVAGVYKHKERGKTFLVYKINWTNTTNEPIPYLQAFINIDAYQNGIECEPGFVMDIDSNNMTNIMPGKSLTSYDFVELSDSSKVETHISDSLDFGNTDPIVFTTDLSKIKSI
jgi:hypothetical protein